jgi:rod shape-determining protein MreC
VALRTRARSTRLLVVALVSASLVTITIDYRQGDGGPLAAAGDTALTVISPLQEAVSKVTHPIGNFFSTLVRLPSIRRELEEARERIAQFQAEIGEERSDQARLAELEAVLGLQDSLSRRLETLAAEVTAYNPSNFEWTITIDHGSGDGVREDMAVIASAGLVGHVVRVGSSSSVVRLIIDPDSAVAGRLDGTGKPGLVEGAGQADLRMELVDPDTEVVPDENVVTAGFRIPGVGASLYPPNILIGSVSRVLDDEGALEKFITVRPAVDFSSLSVVLVVLSSGSG